MWGNKDLNHQLKATGCVWQPRSSQGREHDDEIPHFGYLDTQLRYLRWRSYTSSSDDISTRGTTWPRSWTRVDSGIG